MITYGQEIHWTEFNGTKNSFGIHNAETRDAALKAIAETAPKMGWTPRRWWQWWRWSDTPNRLVQNL